MLYVTQSEHKLYSLAEILNRCQFFHHFLVQRKLVSISLYTDDMVFYYSVTAL